MPFTDNRKENARKLYQYLKKAVQERCEREKKMLANAVVNCEEYVVMELGSDERHYFKAIYVQTKEEEFYTQDCGIGFSRIQNTVLILHKGQNCNIDFRFFPYLLHIRFYEWKTDIKDVFIKNTGPDNLEAETPFGTYIIPSQACYRIAEDALEGRSESRMDS